MRRTALRAAALIAASLVLVGCASGDPEAPAEAQGPNGYELAATLDDGSELWSDRSPESGLTDLILETPEGRMIHSCLGSGPLMCWDDPLEPAMLLVIGPPEGTAATLSWYGESLPLTAGEREADDAPSVFALVLPDYEANDQGWRLEVTDAAGAVVMTS
ncbi:hypothetical protein FQ330_12475 [Agrococcus sediminis]|uniref:Lipoprotein n=1 Tax=Agrococcus sediminis TaxID=2599924 RepID=A0A5M8Q3S6_9MICO|nr:hypothetical protein [Agrococcus sediminis]KAA6430535.1 hypothetical protein FQ330_12475 [Agrococcus sediminis]